MIKVGEGKGWKQNYEGKKVKIPYTYADIKFDKSGWSDADEYMPGDYDLVHMRVAGKPNIIGWATGRNWDGLRLKLDDKVTAWKRSKTESDFGVIEDL